jgi:hypothetical protein
MREGDAALRAGKHAGGALLDKHSLRKHGAQATYGQGRGRGLSRNA